MTKKYTVRLGSTYTAREVEVYASSPADAIRRTRACYGQWLAPRIVKTELSAETVRRPATAQQEGR